MKSLYMGRAMIAVEMPTRREEKVQSSPVLVWGITSSSSKVSG